MVWIVVIVLVLLVGGWYFYSQGSATTTPIPTQSTQTTTQNPATTTTSVATTNTTVAPVLSLGSSAALGSYLVAQNGMTLYKYTPDKPGVSNCTGQCAVLWPPYTISPGASLAAMSGINGTLATITRADGTTQLTYNGMPLYFYVKDAKPGDTTGQGVGGVWFVVTP